MARINRLTVLNELANVYGLPVKTYDAADLVSFFYANGSEDLLGELLLSIDEDSARRAVRKACGDGAVLIPSGVRVLSGESGWRGAVDALAEEFRAGTMNGNRRIALDLVGGQAVRFKVKGLPLDFAEQAEEAIEGDSAIAGLFELLKEDKADDARRAAEELAEVQAEAEADRQAREMAAEVNLERFDDYPLMTYLLKESGPTPCPCEVDFTIAGPQEILKAEKAEEARRVAHEDFFASLWQDDDEESCPTE